MRQALAHRGVIAGQLSRLEGAQTLSLAFEAAESSAANELAQVVGTIGAESSPDLARLPLDHTGLPGCSDACVEESLKASPTHVLTFYVLQHAEQAP